MKKLLTVFIMAVLLAGCDKLGHKPLTFQSTDVTGLEYARDFALLDHNGKPRTLADFRGKVVVLFFGYTQCPDVCPTTMAELAGAMKELGAKSDEVQVLFVTLDPARDKPELLAQYAPAFDKRFLALYGTPEQTDKVAKEFKVFYSKVPGATPGSYTIDHMAGSYVFDREGRLRLFVRNGQNPAALMHDIRLLLS
jgi:protein SCO1/2